MSTTSTFHAGELAVQERAGATAQGRNSGRLVADSIIPGAIKFVKKQPLLVMGSVDERDNLWASILVGQPGFLVAESQCIDVDLRQALQTRHDPLWKNLEQNSQVGLLVIDLRSRARLRVNGRVEFPNKNQMHVVVEQAYPNCPQYIQRRNYRPTSDEESTAEPTARRGNQLSDEQQRWVSNVDTLFVASEHPSHGVDASHRGGNPGFIQALSSTRLRIPDYAGNGMFNTLGNFAVNPQAGLVIPDFENGRTLQLTGNATIIWDSDDPGNDTGGTQRYWDFTIDRWVQIENALAGSVEFLDYSPHNPDVRA